jgi:hypothetical protein
MIYALIVRLYVASDSWKFLLSIDGFKKNMIPLHINIKILKSKSCEKPE